MLEMIQNLTLLDITLILAFILGLIEGIRRLKKIIKQFFDECFKAINDRLDEIDTQTCKNFLIRYLADIERGSHIYAPEKQRFWEEYDHYTNELKENSYIKEWVIQLKKEGKLSR